MMKALGIKSPGTIYPVLEDLSQKGLVSFQEEVVGAVRKKNYSLTEKGRNSLRDMLTKSTKLFCCDPSLYADTIFRDVRSLLRIEKSQRVLALFDHVNLRSITQGAEVTYASDIEEVDGKFEIIMSFGGVSCLYGAINGDREQLYASAYKKLQKGGVFLDIEIEKTDNLFARIFFEELRKMPTQPGMTVEELDRALSLAGFQTIKISQKSGLLYALAAG